MQDYKGLIRMIIRDMSGSAFEKAERLPCHVKSNRQHSVPVHPDFVGAVPDCVDGHNAIRAQE